MKFNIVSAIGLLNNCIKATLTELHIADNNL